MRKTLTLFVLTLLAGLTLAQAQVQLTFASAYAPDDHQTLAVDEFLAGGADEVYLAYTDFLSLLRQTPTVKKLLPLEVGEKAQLVEQEFARPAGPPAAYIYEPDQAGLLGEIIPRFTALQVFQAVLESQASEHAARMVAMQNATDNARDLSGALQLTYNKARQGAITNEMLDIAGGAEALAQARAG